MTGIHRSSIVAWACFGLAVVLTALLSPEAMRGQEGIGVALIGAAVLVFFAVVMAVQTQLGFPLDASSMAVPAALTTTGVYGWSRNPIYAAFLLPLLAFAWLSPAAALLAATAYVVAMNIWVIAPEERALRTLFGEGFDAYAGRVRRWV